MFLVDSGKENGKIDFGVRRKRTISNTTNRLDFIRRTNNDAISKGHVSDGLSVRLGNGTSSDTGRNLRRESGAELSADKGKSSDNQSGVSGENADKRGLKGKASRDLDFVDFLNENTEERERSNRDILASSFIDGENIVPVKLEIKKFSDKENTLYVAIALESIKIDGIVKQEVAEDGVAQQYSPPSNISIAHKSKNVN